MCWLRFHIPEVAARTETTGLESIWAIHNKSHNTFHLSFDTEIGLLRIYPKGMAKQITLHCYFQKQRLGHKLESPTIRNG